MTHSCNKAQINKSGFMMWAYIDKGLSHGNCLALFLNTITYVLVDVKLCM